MTVVHLKAKEEFRDARANEIKQIRFFNDSLSKIYNPDFEIILGDFNDTPEAPFIDALG